MKMPGFTASVSLSRAMGQPRAEFTPFTSRGAVLPQMDAVVLDEIYEENGKKTHVTVTVSTPFDPEGAPEFFESFGLSQKASRGEYIFSGPGKAGIGEGGGTYFRAKRQQCMEECARIYEQKKLACATENDPSTCLNNAYWEYWDCYGACSPL